MTDITDKTAQAPGTLHYVGEMAGTKIDLAILEYDDKHYREQQVDDLDEIDWQDALATRWLDISGVHSKSLVSRVGERFSVHPLVLEDIMNTSQRAKFEDHDHYLFLVFKMLYLDDQTEKIEAEQISLIVKGELIISWQEKPGDVFDPIRRRIKYTQWRSRKLGADYLAYALLDAVVDHYFVLLEKINEQIETIEAELNARPEPGTLEKIHQLKGKIIFINKTIWPIRELIANMERSESALIKADTKLYLRDSYDHIIQIMESAESKRDIISSLQDLYLSAISHRMNEVMKVLTIIATLFIPPTFIAGIYGMNFELMPELKWPYGYVTALGGMGLLMLGMMVLFKRKKWF